MADIVEHYSGPFDRGPDQVSGGAEHMRLILRQSDGSEVELFKGDKFSEEEWQRDMMRRYGNLEGRLGGR